MLSDSIINNSIAAISETATHDNQINQINQSHHQMISQHQTTSTSTSSQHHGKVHQLPLSEDPRTLQLALELSLVGLGENGLNPNGFAQPIAAQPMAELNYDLGSINLVSAAYARSAQQEMPLNSLAASLATPSGNGNGNGIGNGSGLLMPSAGLEDRSKKSQNMTECVPVPSSEHVAEIVGRQGELTRLGETLCIQHFYFIQFCPLSFSSIPVK